MFRTYVKGREKLFEVWRPYVDEKTSMKFLAFRARVPLYTLSKVLRGVTIPADPVLRRIARAMGMRYKDFMRRLAYTVEIRESLRTRPRRSRSGAPQQRPNRAEDPK